MRGENNRRTILMDLDAGTFGMLGVTGLEGGCYHYIGTHQPP